MFIMVLLCVAVGMPGYSQRVNDFALNDVVSGNAFSLSQHKSATAIVLVFTTNTCPYSNLYESRIVDLANRYQNQNFTIALVNPQADAAEGESTAEMISKSKAAFSGLPYLADDGQSLARTLGVSKIPEVVVITGSPEGFIVAYRGGIDNNPQLPQSATKKYLEDALQQIAGNKIPNPSSTRAVGCNLKGN